MGSRCLLLLLVAHSLVLLGHAADVSLPSVVEVGGPREKLCEVCTKVVGQLEDVFSDQSLLNESVALLKGRVCALLPQDQAAQCSELVEQYVPVLFEELEEELTVENICVQATRFCPDSARLASGPFATKGPEECYACRLVVKLLKKHLQNPKTQAKIAAYFINRCSHLSNATRAAQCTEAVNKFLPILFANLNIILDDKKLCKEAGLCSLPGDSTA